MIPESLAALLGALLPQASVVDPAATYGGFSNLTFAATIDGQRCVIKAAASAMPQKCDDVRREARLLPLLRGAQLPVPELLVFGEDASWTVAVTRLIDGLPGLRLYESPQVALPPVFHELGALLACVHRLTPADLGASERSAVLPPLRDMPARAESLTAAQVDLPIDSRLARELAGALERTAVSPAPATLAHGDAGIHNIIWNGGIAGLLDWEWAGWGRSLADLAWINWTISFRGLPPEARAGLVRGYGADRLRELEIQPELVRALALRQIAAIMLRNRAAPGALDEWQRRLLWTLALPEPAWDLLNPR